MTTVPPIAIPNMQPVENKAQIDKVPQEKAYLPGAYAIPPELLTVPKAKKKQGSFLGFVAKILIATALIGGVAIGIKKLFTKNAGKSNIASRAKDKLTDGLSYCKKKVTGLLSNKVEDKKIKKKKRKK